jgi:Na+/H+ antiporter NhaD/arsenite permease-like protein
MGEGEAASQTIFGLHPAWVATILLILIYALIIAERLNRSIIALLGAGLMIVSGVLDQNEAVKGIDFNTIALLAGMMVLVSIARRSGMFEYLAICDPQPVAAAVRSPSAWVKNFRQNCS